MRLFHPKPERRRTVIILVALALWASSPIESVWALGPKSAIPPTKSEGRGADAVLDSVGVTQKLGDSIPLDLEFTDSEGHKKPLRSFIGRRPVVLALVYYECPMLCTMVLNGLLRTMNVLRFDAGKEFDVITVSIDPRETSALASDKKRVYLERYRRAGASEGWHFLVGDQDEIKKLADAVGYHYVYDKETDQFAHGSMITVLSPTGKISKYLYGIDFSPRDLRLSLVEASSERIGSFTDAILLSCFQYNPSEGRYSLAVLNIIRFVGILTVLGIIAFIVVSRVHERRGLTQGTTKSDESGRPVTESGIL